MSQIHEALEHKALPYTWQQVLPLSFQIQKYLTKTGKAVCVSLKACDVIEGASWARELCAVPGAIWTVVTLR